MTNDSQLIYSQLMHYRTMVLQMIAGVEKHRFVLRRAVQDHISLITGSLIVSSMDSSGTIKGALSIVLGQCSVRKLDTSRMLGRSGGSRSVLGEFVAGAR